MHRELADIWLDVDAIPRRAVAIMRGAGKGFSGGGDLDLVEEMTQDFDSARARVARGARSGLQPDQLLEDRVSAMHGPAVGAGLVAGLLADISIAARTRASSTATRAWASRRAITRRSSGRCCAAWRRRSTTCCCASEVSGEEAERIGLVSLCVEEDRAAWTRRCEVAQRLARGSQTALRWTKYCLNNWLRMAGPTFDASLALEMLGFSGPDVREGVASHREKRAPKFSGGGPF